jgi:hypothetical protein
MSLNFDQVGTLAAVGAQIGEQSAVNRPDCRCPRLRRGSGGNAYPIAGVRELANGKKRKFYIRRMSNEYQFDR